MDAGADWVTRVRRRALWRKRVVLACDLIIYGAFVVMLGYYLFTEWL